MLWLVFFFGSAILQNPNRARGALEELKKKEVFVSAEEKPTFFLSTAHYICVLNGAKVSKWSFFLQEAVKEHKCCCECRNFFFKSDSSEQNWRRKKTSSSRKGNAKQRRIIWLLSAKQDASSEEISPIRLVKNQFVLTLSLTRSAFKVSTVKQ